MIPSILEKQVVSKKRVADHGEVYTNPREVNAMLDLVKQEIERIDSRFLEPACGTGNFLTEILARKLRVVETRYSKSQLEFERYIVLAICSIYGIDILEDNVKACRARLFDIVAATHATRWKQPKIARFWEAVVFILERNILHGDALTLRTIATPEKPAEYILFSEWALLGGSQIKRRDFVFKEILERRSSQRGLTTYSDTNKLVFIPEPGKEYPPMHISRIMDADTDQL